MKVTPEILKKYASQQCSQQEREIVEKWLKQQQSEEEEDVLNYDFLEEKIWGNIKEAITDKPYREKKISRKKITWAIAASIVLLIGLGFFQESSTAINSESDKIVICQTSAGQIKNITLSDGTLVYLNANSILKIPKKFTGNRRIISLTGEAYFEVVKDSLRPFTVQTQKSETTVLGTKFNLSAYANESAIVTLDEGKVSFKDRKNISKSLIVLPGEQVILNDENLIKTNVNTKYYKGWMNNILYFNNESFLAVSHKIERLYGVEIQIRNQQLKNQIYKGEFNNPEIETLLEDLSFVLKFKYEVKEKQIIIY